MPCRRAQPVALRIFAVALLLQVAPCLAGIPGGLPAHRAESATVATDQGLVRGIRREGVGAFLGIPYAAPPVGELRWRAPRPVAPWRGVRAAVQPPPSCMQPWPAPSFGPYTREFVETPRPSEDCLYLDVWAPARAARPLPVLVWIHGGGFLGGSASVPIYDGARLAARGAVVVGINYRVGPFGFLAHPALTAGDERQASGNYGLLDQVAALRWVQRNIARFGGDPGNVTIAGQSAGAASVTALMAMPAAAGLFHKAIVESGVGMGIGLPTLAQAEAEGTRFGEYLGAHDAQSLRALPAERIQSAVWLPIGPPGQGGPPPLRFRPLLDVATLPQDPQQGALAASLTVLVLAGYTADEVMDTGVRDVAGFESLVRQRYGASADALLAAYPHAGDAEAVESARLLARDRAMSAQLLWARERVQAGGGPVYLYRFAQAPPVAQPPSFGAFHTAEVPYVFGNLDTAARPWTASDRRISNEVQARWLAFMATGSPEVAGAAAWPRVTAASTDLMVIGPGAGAWPAVSSPQRWQVLQDYVAGGGALSLF